MFSVVCHLLQCGNQNLTGILELRGIRAVAPAELLHTRKLQGEQIRSLVLSQVLVSHQLERDRERQRGYERETEKLRQEKKKDTELKWVKG